MPDIDNLFSDEMPKKEISNKSNKLKKVKSKIHNNLIEAVKPEQLPLIKTGLKIDDIVKLTISNRLVLGGFTNTGKSALASYIAVKSLDAFKEYYEKQGRLDEMKDRLKIYVIDTEIGETQSPMYMKYPELFDFNFKVSTLKDLRRLIDNGIMDIIAEKYAVIIVDSISALLNHPMYFWQEEIDKHTGEERMKLGEGTPYIQRKRDLLPLINWMRNYQAGVIHGEKEPLLFIMIAHLTKSMRPDQTEPEKLIYGQYTFGSGLHEELMYVSDNILIIGTVVNTNKNNRSQFNFTNQNEFKIEVGTFKTRGIMRGQKVIIKLKKDGTFTN